MAVMSAKRQQELLAKIENRRAILENAVVGVVRGFTSALFVWGPPGLGKSHLLTVMLDGIAGNGWRHHTAHSTPKALFMSLVADPAAIHLYEDCERLLKTDLSASILRAACGSPNERDRWVTYETANEILRVKVTGGIVIATNQNLSRVNGPLQGVASRFRPIRWDMALEERIAMILHMADRPFRKQGVDVTTKECRKVAARLIEMVSESRSDLDLDLRLFAEHALPAFAQAKSMPGTNWEDLMQAKLLGVAQTAEDTQLERTRRLQQLAQKIHLEGGSTKQKIAKWKSLTDLGQAIYYRHLKGGKIS
jgi:hypothetical protein